jgi:lipopolysaccharide assembly LptE-like protein
MRRGRAATVGLCLMGLLAGGCGYTLGGNLPPHVKTVAVPMFKNLTQQPAIENVITAAVVNAFAGGGRLKVVPVEQADSILEGEIVGYSVESIAYDSSINAQAFRLRVRLNIQFRDVRDNTMLWRQEGLEERSDFRVSGQVSQTLSAEREGAAGQAAVDIGRKIVSLALDRF